jgi:hypothetical protein
MATMLLGFLVGALVFAVLPVGSQTSQLQYDPWADINGDGKIDIYDIAYSAIRFGSSGDPTRQVVISRHEAFSQVVNFTVTAPGYYYWANTTGFERLSVAIKVKGTATVFLCWYWNEPMPPLIAANFTVINSEQCYMWMSQVQAPLLCIYYAQAGGIIDCYTVIAVYLTA